MSNYDFNFKNRMVRNLVLLLFFGALYGIYRLGMLLWEILKDAAQ